MASFARNITRVKRLLDALLAQPMATDQWPVIDTRLTSLAAALEARDRPKADEICLAMERQYCSTPYLLRTFETLDSWNARIPAPRATRDLAARVQQADF